MSYIPNEQTVDIVHAAGMMNVGHNIVRARINSGELRAAKIGSGFVMMRKDVIDLIDREITRQTAERMRADPRNKTGGNKA